MLVLLVACAIVIVMFELFAAILNAVGRLSRKAAPQQLTQQH
jgi:hypothetical protein